ncbi:hypothetical protein BDB00DRAFT_840595 [Zychaea mexicana]|uniref:uncharacterized protein n=1 Tax=Zychaea mexicana TaxID=64656 RepID=UPI0022FF2301|nr:uncharacterized protein BDB00DRAFT_840595 [Zychaea mexicana]KAI9489908.1 hypothetical protein BDB00DRAFT_840595 [Zychaea mexicana]
MTAKEQNEKQQENKIKRLLKNDQFQGVIILILINLALPLAIYYSFRTFTSEIIALIVSGIPPCLRAIYIFIKHRTVDILSCIIVLSFVLSGVLTAIQGDARVALLRDSFVTAVIGLMFFLTLIPLSTRWFTIFPMTHLVGRQLFAALPMQQWTDEEGTKRELTIPSFMWQEMHDYRKYSYLLTFLWGFGLLVEFGSRAAMIYTGVDVDKIVGIGTAVSASINSVLGAISAASYFVLRRRFNQFDKRWRELNDFTQKQEEPQTLDPQSHSNI